MDANSSLPKHNEEIIPRRRRNKRLKRPDAELIQLFWSAPNEAFFGQETIAPVTSSSIKTLESNRWRGKGIPYRKCAGRVLYRKADVIAWLESHALVSSTSEYCGMGVNHA